MRPADLILKLLSAMAAAVHAACELYRAIKRNVSAVISEIKKHKKGSSK